MKQTHRTFNIYWIQRLLITSIFILASTLLYAQCYVSPTKYDYSTLAKSITKNAKSKLEKNRAIFNWICENIAYDTSYTIYTADECYEQKKGVCQAYSELYYRLCEAVGIKCIIISGKTKDYTGTINEKGHAWIYAELEKGSILVDPTWGAGYTNNNTFTFHKKDFWFQIDPYWLIFTHFPNDEQFQFLKKTIDFQTFSQLPPLNPSCQYLGFKAQDIFNKIGKKKITSLPHIYSFDKEEALILNKTPLQETLNPATKYKFEIENPNNLEFAIIVNNTWYHSNQWKKKGNKYTLELLPAEGGELTISIKGKDMSSYNTLIKYKLTKPTTREQKYINEKRPPIKKSVDFSRIKILKSPKQMNLNPATTYRFEVENPTHQDFAIITNKTWYYSSQWQKKGSKYWIDFMPADEGELKISIKDPKDNLYYPLVIYNVLKPTQQELEFIENHRPPIIYNPTNNNNLKLINIPKYKKLNPATTYRFEVENPTHQDFAIITNETWYYSSQWQKEGSKYWIDLMPADEGELKISIKNQTDTRYSTLVEYTVLAPTQQELEFIENHRPPIFYDVTNNNLKLINTPKYRKLNPATTYRFEVENPTHQDFAIIINKTWYYSSQWQKEGSKYWIDIMPAEGGTLKLSVQNSGLYYTFVEYNITIPTVQEQQKIKQKNIKS